MTLYHIIMIWLLIITLLICVLWEKSLLLNKSPFISVSKKILDKISETLALAPDDVLYDLGSGDGRILEVCFHHQPQANYFGVEKEFFPHFLAKFKLRKNKQIKLLRKNFFEIDLSSATHIFTYLFPKLMDELLPKLEKELKPGTKLISCDFIFTNKKPYKIIDLGRSKYSLTNRLIIYIF